MMNFLFILFYLGICLSVAMIGRDRKIGFWPLMAISILLSPLFGLICGLLSKRMKPMDVFVVINQKGPEPIKTEDIPYVELPPDSPSQKLKIER